MKPYGPAYAMLAVLGLATPAWAAGPPGDRFGIALQEPNGVCLYTDSRLRPGSAVAIVIPLPPQDAATAYAVYFGPGCAGSSGRAGVRLVPPGVMGRNTIALAVFGPGGRCDRDGRLGTDQGRHGHTVHGPDLLVGQGRAPHRMAGRTIAGAARLPRRRGSPTHG